MQALAVSKQSANQIIKDFMNKGILVEVTGNQRNRIYYFKKYYGLFVV
jgi:ribosomal protein S25